MATTSKWIVKSRSSVYQEPIISFKSVTVNGVTKYVINETYWSTQKPSEEAAFVNLQNVGLETADGKEQQNGINVISYAVRSRAFSLEDKIKTIQENPEVAMALATLLR